jgi:alanyl-tRNA synthetase
MQGVDSNYSTDLFQPILMATAEAAGKKYGANPDDPAAALDDTSMRVIADHIRAVSFLLADGVIPSNDGRGYVLRRVLRRAVRHGMNLGFEEPFLSSLVPVLGNVMGDAYPELGKTASASMATIEAEEEKFLSTVARAAQKVQQSIETTRAAGGNVLDGATLYHLYETYGLPVEVAQEIAEEEQFSVDHAGFEVAKKEAQELSRSASSMTGQSGVRELLFGESDEEGGATRFCGYDRLELEGAIVVALARKTGSDKADGALEAVDRLAEGERGIAVFDRTVFYAESGGQVGDRGALRGSPGGFVEARVVDTQKEGGVFLHSVEILNGSLEVGARLDLTVDGEQRRPTERHHTATHLLHASLRQHLGEGVRQAGSLVEPDRLRFDFTHGGPLDAEELSRVERTVNDWVRRAVPVEISEKSYDEAIDQGAMALFGEKYGDVVRTVNVPGFSLELCGGCHVKNSGAIGEFIVVSERGVASGVRRIEALAGDRAEAVRRSEHATLQAIEQSLGVGAQRAVDEIVALRETIKAQEKELSRLRMKLMSGDAAAGESGERTINGIKLLTREVPPAPSSELRNLADVLRGKLGSGVVVLGTRADDKVNLVAAVSADLTDRIDAGKIARGLGDVVGGSGGGRKDFAQAGGKDPDRLEDAFRAVEEAIQEMTKTQ